MLIDLSKPLPLGADGADFVESGVTWAQWVEWIKPKLRVYKRVDTISAVAIAENEKTVAISGVKVDVHTEDAPFTTVSMYKLWVDMGLSLTKGDQPNINYDNVRRVVEKHKPLNGIVWFDEFHEKIFTEYGEGGLREWDDNDDGELATYFQCELGIARMNKECIRTGVTLYAMKHKRNEPKDWMESLKWDGVDRIYKFFPKYYNTEDDAYHMKAAANFWIGMVARIYRPGCKNDHMIVLEGPQGCFKSTSLEIIGGPWYAEATESIQSGADFYMTLAGKLLIEIAELDSFGKADVTRIKQTISCAKDRYRASYDRRPKDHLRQSIFAGSTNEDSYLRDTTGGRRFWPIKTVKIDLKSLAEDREQLFAQAVHQFKQGDEWWIMPWDETKEVQESRRQRDEWEQIIERHIQFKEEITMAEIATECLKIEIGRLDKQTQLRIGNNLRALKWYRVKLRRGDKCVWTWKKLIQ